MTNEQPERRRVERRLAERQADAAALSGREGLRADVADLALEVHKLRGTLQSFASRAEVEREISGRIRALEVDLASARRARARQLGAAMVVLLLVIAGLQVRTYRRLDTSVREAVISTCEQRRELEDVLRGILVQTERLPRNEDAAARDARQRLYADAIRRLQSPPCETLFVP